MAALPWNFDASITYDKPVNIDICKPTTEPNAAALTAVRQPQPAAKLSFDLVCCKCKQGLLRILAAMLRQDCGYCALKCRR